MGYVFPEEENDEDLPLQLKLAQLEFESLPNTHCPHAELRRGLAEDAENIRAGRENLQVRVTVLASAEHVSVQKTFDIIG